MHGAATGTHRKRLKKKGGGAGRVCIGGKERDKRRVGVIDTSCLRCRISTSFQGAITLRAHKEMDTVCKSCTHV